MAFPTTSLLDDFNRANSTDLGSAWTELSTGLEISSNRLIRTGSGLAYWNAAKFTDCEVYARLGVVNSNNAHYLGWRVALAADRSQDPTTVANWSGYYLDVNPGLDRIRVYRYNGGSDTQIGSDITVTGLAVDDLVGVQMSGSAIKVFHKPAAGSWTEIRSDSNSTYTDAGRLTVELGAGSNHAWDDYSGGEVGGFPTTDILDDFNRADENPLSQGGTWDGPIRAGSRTDIRLVSNEIARQTTGSTSEAYRTGTSFTDAEAYFTVKALPTDNGAIAVAIARVQTPGSTNADFYAMELSRIGTGNYSIDAYRVIDAAFTSLASVATGINLQVGHKYGMEVTGTGATVTLRCFMDTGSGWAQVGTDVSDTDASRITAAGPVGVSIGGTTSTLWRLDDFGGGEVARFPHGSLPWFRSL